jgi:hypothetical protein
MFGYPGSELRGQKTYRIRVQSSLKNQIKAGYNELAWLWKEFQSGQMSIESGERILEKIGWIKTAINEFRDINGGDSEGVSWAGLETIDENVQSMESEIMRIIVRDIKIILR